MSIISKICHIGSFIIYRMILYHFARRIMGEKSHIRLILCLSVVEKTPFFAPVAKWLKK
jgi:hypothetical protein